jgi:hypothetical protein
MNAPADDVNPSAPPAESSAFWRNPVLYPGRSPMYAYVAALDLFFTRIILEVDGRAATFVADWLLQQWNVRGLVVFKFLSVVLVLLICELVGRRRRRLGGQLAGWAVVISAFPVVVGAFHVLRIALGARGLPAHPTIMS